MIANGKRKRFVYRTALMDSVAIITNVLVSL